MSPERLEEILTTAKSREDAIRMANVFRRSDTKKMMEDMAMLYILDLRYDRGDICIAMKIVETEKGWH